MGDRVSQIAPYGTWDSPITSASVAKLSISTEDVLVDGVTGTIYRVEKRPEEGGRNALVRAEDGTDVLGGKWNVRTAVHEYGGAAAIIHDNVGLFSNAEDAQVYRVDLNAVSNTKPRPVTSSPKCRFAAFAIHPVHTDIAVSIMEDHTQSSAKDVVNTLVSFSSSELTVLPSCLISGADFYANPTFNPDGSLLAWSQWSHPDMPWDGEQIYVAAVDVVHGRLNLTTERFSPYRVAGQPSTISAVQPTWISLNALVFSCDISSFHNPWLGVVNTKTKSVSRRPLLPSPLELDFIDPSWWLGGSNITVLDDNLILFAASKGGRSVFHLVSLDSGHSTVLESPYVHIARMRRVGPWQAVFLGSRVDSGTETILCTFPTADAVLAPTFRTLTSYIEPVLPDPYLSLPMALELALLDSPNEVVHAVYYLPRNPDYRCVPGERPPAIVNVHGGPTYLARQDFDLEKHFFTTRGWVWIDVNYSGSSNFGRDYINRLKGSWGVRDVRDCTQVALILSSYPYNIIDRKRIVIRGGSAGGYTTLVALSQPDNVFAAGTSSYGISDLHKLTQFTHKFQSHYAQALIGGSFEDIPDVYHARSPVFHAHDISVPLLILQGALDPIVPRNQAEDLVKAIKSTGGTAEYVLFEDEGHGWRNAESTQKALDSELAFYQRALALVS
ncbi:Dipeptidyl peptidase family member 6 [Mycena indigotica]|uniref:Dipeptidyl peptidase family member 6 n=1 Tax=Mycena indigotica TaxID=2126181 RepID=A0A8H6VVI8_9AGAR|nr:Dipeptidyl peptidase family member 6 [Mycena indigotica]KAF7289824.1 Dipeptidyl peptidase family member 6 [Mycena indigotica]